MKKHISVRTKGSVRLVKLAAILLAIVLLILGALQGGYLHLHATHKVFSPNYAKKDISPLFNKKELSIQDYDLIFNQTGLSKAAVDDFLEGGQETEILKAQTDFFGNYETDYTLFAPFTCCHKVNEEITVAPLKKGDIIVSLTTHFTGFMLGHATIVTDPEYDQTVVSIGYMSRSFLGVVSDATNRESFVILRHSDTEKASAAADYANENLVNLPYSISVGFTTKKFPEKPLVTQCGHLVWYAYKKQGIDIDSNGGPFVYPKDILASEHLEVVQVFGMNPNDFKK